LQKILEHLKIPIVVEMNKKHPRDHFCVGRVRYNLKNEAGDFVNDKIQNSEIFVKCRICLV
jgi:hypothetical protein